MFKFMLRHPLTKHQKVPTLIRFLKWQFYGRMFPYPVIYPFIGDVKLIVSKGETGATGNIYVGLHEFEEMSFVLHLVKQDDLFVDIGANIGSFTLLASGYKKANSIAIEPAPKTYEKLESNIAINKLYNRVKLLNMCAGESDYRVRFTTQFDTENHVLPTIDISGDSVMVDVKKLDDILQNQTPILLKIDVEGYETNVLEGATLTLSNPNLKAIIIELNGSGLRYGYDEQKIRIKLSELGFKPFHYDPFTRKLLLLTAFNNNVIYVRDIDFVKERLVKSEKFNIFGYSI